MTCEHFSIHHKVLWLQDQLPTGSRMCMMLKKVRLTSGDIGLLTGPHQTSLSDPGSFTTLLSKGDRPVLAPEYAVKAPVEVIAVPGS
jgi:hypothetical protein